MINTAIEHVCEAFTEEYNEHIKLAKDMAAGAALAELVKNQLHDKGATSIGALIHKGKITKNFYKELIDYEFNYVLVSKKVSYNSNI